MFKVLVSFGTRPEAIKMCPLVIGLRKEENIECKICLTGQHKEMLDQVMEVFRIEADYNLDIMKENQSLSMINASILEKIDPVLDKERPDIVLVHGDTSSSYVVAMAAFYKHIPVGHVEAGLRSGNIYSPFPEEMNRILTDRISSICFAPTEANRLKLEKEGINDNVYVTGNTVIDSFAYTIRENYVYADRVLREIRSTDRIILVTAHRRENLGRPLENICDALTEISRRHKDIIIVYPVHKNPAVRNTVFEKLQGIRNVYLTEPLDVLDMHNLMSDCYFVMTDSGGLQEEAPHLGKPVLVLRTETERQEAVEAGTVKVVGVETKTIIEEAEVLINDHSEYEKMAHAINPYGDGHSSTRIISFLKNYMEETRWRN